MIGILIALYINNQNEQRKEQERFDMVLVDVERELIDNILYTRDIINTLSLYDSIFLNILVDVDSLKLVNPMTYSIVTADWIGNSRSENSFQKLTQITNINDQQESILGELIGLYNVDFDPTSTGKEITDLGKSNKKVFQKYAWYESWVFGRYNDDKMIDYFENNPEYRRMLLNHFLLYNQKRTQESQYDRLAVPLYKKVNKYLDRISVRRSDSLDLEYDINDFKHYLGKYNLKWSRTIADIVTDSVVIRIENDELYWTDYVSGEIDWNTKIIPINKYRFRLERYPGTGHLDFNDQEEVKGLRYVMRPSAIGWWKKVR